MYRLIGKVKRNDIIVGYQLQDMHTNAIVIFPREAALRRINQISNAKLHGNYLVTTDNTQLNILKASTAKRLNKTRFRDFSSYPLSPLLLGGVSSKTVIKDSIGQEWLIKTERFSNRGKVIKDYLSEYISCRTAKMLGYPVQEVELGYYYGKECTAIKLFKQVPVTFSGLGYSTLNSYPLGRRDKRYDFKWLLNLKMSPDKFSITQEQYTKWVWRVFVLDLLLGNYDRHEGNWGFFIKDGKKYPAPLYDFGATLYIRELDEVSTWTDGVLKSEIETGVRSAIYCDGKKRGYFYLLETYKDTADLKTALFELLNRWKDIQPELNKLLGQITEYNKAYTDYVRFIKKLLNTKIKLLEERYRRWYL